MSMRKTSTASAPCSTANLGPGFDVFGLALDALHDTVTIQKSERQHGFNIEIRGPYAGDISSVPDENSAGIVVKKMCSELAIKDEALDIIIDKGVPPGYGMGSSGASAAAAAVALDHLLELATEKSRLVKFAAAGEMASAGAEHFDNVSSSLLGGFVISHMAGGVPQEFIRLDPPENLWLVVAVPMVKVPKHKTGVARSVLPHEVPLQKVIHNVSAASTIVAGFAQKNVKLIASGIDDVIVEPARKKLIPGYEDVKSLATSAGALAVTISGAGPSLISILEGKSASQHVSNAMQQGFEKAGLGSKIFVCRSSSGARIIS